MSDEQPVRRYRCTACGNLTRFDVTSSRRTRAFHHYSVSGELEVEDEEVLGEQVEDVSCRWCGSGDSVVALEPDLGAELEADRAGRTEG
jgi:hypothetical protein